MVQGHRLNHILHLILSLLTLGIWMIVWVAMGIFGGEKREVINVDDWGTPTVTRL